MSTRYERVGGVRFASFVPKGVRLLASVEPNMSINFNVQVSLTVQYTDIEFYYKSALCLARVKEKHFTLPVLKVVLA